MKLIKHSFWSLLLKLSVAPDVLLVARVTKTNALGQESYVLGVYLNVVYAWGIRQMNMASIVCGCERIQQIFKPGYMLDRIFLTLVMYTLLYSLKEPFIFEASSG